jgi:hypothetical protein
MMDKTEEKRIMNLYYKKLNQASLAQQNGDRLLFTVLTSQAEEIGKLIDHLTELELN